MSEEELTRIATEITDRLCPPSKLVVGKYYMYKGEVVKITSGYYRDPTYNRISNFWSWRKINKDGSLSLVVEDGYDHGGFTGPIEETSIMIMLKGD